MEHNGLCSALSKEVSCLIDGDMQQETNRIVVIVFQREGGSPTARNTSPIRLRRDATSENIDESSAESLQRRQN